MANALEILSQNIEIMEPKNGLAEKLALAAKEARPLRVKLGFDPTAPDLHLGHAVVMEKLRQFQDFGHTVVVLIGDFTARIGDPTGRNKTRPPLSDEQIKINAQTYVDQLSRILDVSKLEIVYNSTWLDKMGAGDFIKLMAKVTVAQIIQREDFKNRLGDGIPVGMHEIVYPLMQGYDSVAINADIELGGTDQLFNCLMGRSLQESYGKAGQVVMALPLLVGLDGTEKMSKSKGNTIGLLDAPEDMFGKAMSIPDAALTSYIKLALGVAGDQLKESLLADLAREGTNPMTIKKAVAFHIVARFYGEEKATAAEAHFRRTVQEREAKAEDYEKVALGALTLPAEATLLDLCHALQPEMSRGDIRRLITGGGVKLAGEKKMDPLEKVSPAAGLRLQLGKRRLIELAA